jgi:mRNA interferase MazF
MGVPAVGEVVLVPFPFSDLSQSKVRPAVCLAAAGGIDWVLCQLTSKAYGDSRAVSLDKTAFASGGLKITSFARPGKLFTASQSLIVGSAGKLSDAVFQRVLDAVMKLLRPGGP